MEKMGEHFMCVERITKILLATILGIVMMLASTGSIKSAFLFYSLDVIVIHRFSSFSGYSLMSKVSKRLFPMCNKQG